MYVIMQKDIETRQTMVIAGIEATDKEEAQAEFTEWIRARIIEDGAGTHKPYPIPGLYDNQDRALLYDSETATSFLLNGDLFFLYEGEPEEDEV